MQLSSAQLAETPSDSCFRHRLVHLAAAAEMCGRLSSRHKGDLLITIWFYDNKSSMVLS